MQEYVFEIIGAIVGILGVLFAFSTWRKERRALRPTPLRLTQIAAFFNEVDGSEEDNIAQITLDIDIYNPSEIIKEVVGFRVRYTRHQSDSRTGADLFNVPPHSLSQKLPITLESRRVCRLRLSFLIPPKVKMVAHIDRFDIEAITAEGEKVATRVSSLVRIESESISDT